MAIKNICYKLNSELKKIFDVSYSKGIETYFIIRNFSSIDNNQIIHLLSNNKKVIISDLAVICVKKMLDLYNAIKYDLNLVKNLFISKESLFKFSFHDIYYDYLKQNEISTNYLVDDLVRSDVYLNSSIKIKYIESPSFLLKCLDNAIFLKKPILDKLNQNVCLTNEFNQFINVYKILSSNLIPSTSIFLEKVSKKIDVNCNVVDNIAYEDLIMFDSNNIGIIDVIDFDPFSISKLTKYEKRVVGFDPDLDASWIDLVSIKHKIKKMKINSLIINNIWLLDNLKQIKICCEYGFNKIRTKYAQHLNESDNIVPLYYKFDGWMKSIDNIENKQDIPNELIELLKYFKKELNLKEVVVKLNKIDVIV